MTEKQKVNLFEMKYLECMAGVTRRVRIRNNAVYRRAGVKTKTTCRVDSSVLSLFSHMKRKN